MRVKWLNKALQNLENEATFIAQDDPKAAAIVVQRVFNQVDKLAESVRRPKSAVGDQCSALAIGSLSLDNHARDFIREELSFRFIECDCGQAALELFKSGR